LKCRHCQSERLEKFLDLGFAPPSNAYLAETDLSRAEVTFPLRVCVCTDCWLAQTEDYAAADHLFDKDYAYFSSTSKSWLDHASRYATMITERLGLGPFSHVVEIASNDGYLLRNFVDAGIACLGVEPTSSTASAARTAGVPTVEEFFGEAFASELVAQGKQADLIIGNNVFAHVPDINDFSRGLRRLLKPSGTITLEFPHLLQLLKFSQFDTVYHEHFSYLSLIAVQSVLQQADLKIIDVEELPTHGGSLRVYAAHQADKRQAKEVVASALKQERDFGLTNIARYHKLQSDAERIKDDVIQFLIEQKRNGKKVVGYGAAAKGNTLMNFAGIKPDLLSYVCDAAPSKQGKFMPGSHIPIVSPDHLATDPPDVVLILPWNIAQEVRKGLQSRIQPNALIAVAIPALKTEALDAE
jgi:SAM-dependent methyltransferase